MRARNLKPGFFKNEVLGSADPLNAILFEGLWCLADRKGRLEDRPLRICAEVFPYRRALTDKKVDAMLGWLHERDFIKRYEVGGRKFIQVLTFGKHQKPHQREVESDIPSEPDKNQQHNSQQALPKSHPGSDKVVPSPNQARSSPEKARSSPASSLNPHSLTPESPFIESRKAADPDGASVVGGDRPRPGQTSIPGSTAIPKRQTEAEQMASFDRVKRAYPMPSRWVNARDFERNCQLLIERFGQTWESLEAKARAYCIHIDSGGASSRDMAKSPEKFFALSRDAPWTHDWQPLADADAQPEITWRPPPDDDEEPARANG